MTGPVFMAIKEDSTMAKGQKRGNREIKKPKAVKKPVASDVAVRDQIHIRTAQPDNSGKGHAT
jgi:hypothetical protein